MAAMTMTNHREDIKAYAEAVAADMRCLLAAFNEEPTDVDRFVNLTGTTADFDDRPDDALVGAGAYVLDVEHTALMSVSPDGDIGYGDPEETRLILTIGGPTVIVTYSHRYDTAELFHSWGKIRVAFGPGGREWNERDRTTWPLDADVVSEFVSTFFPHPAEVA